MAKTLEDVSLLAVAKATPPVILHQDDVRELGRYIFRDHAKLFERLENIYRNAGVETRYSCVPLDWYTEDHSWQERMLLYEHHALNLIEEAGLKALEQSHLSPRDIDAVICVSSTGIVTPTLDCLLSERIGLRPDVKRLPVFGLGCAGGVSGMAQAANEARVNPEGNILFLVVELCALTFRANDATKANLIATALFGDGAAAAVLRRSDAPGEDVLGTLKSSAEHRWPDTRDIMGWAIENDGLSVIFSRDIPHFVSHNVAPVLTRFLNRNNLVMEDLAGFIFHPGGTKVLDAYAACLDQEPARFDLSRQSLREFGNMSAVSVMTVLIAAIRDKRTGLHLMMALGPGFTVTFQLIHLR